MNHKQRILAKLLVGVGLVSAQFGAPLYAQESDNLSFDLEEIIVTANRREQSIQDVSGVVQTLSADELRKGGITDFRQLQLAVPGLNIANQEGNVEIFIRGVGSANNTELGDPATAPHLNGIYIPRPRGLGGFFYDIERVEVNKGPQGTLYGRNALAGTLNIITKRPDFEGVSGYAQVDVQSRSGYGIEAAVNVPVSETSALRFAGFTKEADFDFNNLGVDGFDPAGLQEDYGARITYLNEPNERLSVLLTADFGHEGGTGYPGSDVQEAVKENPGSRPEDFNLRNVRYRGTQGDLDNDIFGLQATVTYAFDGFDLEYNGSFRQVRFEQTNAANAGVAYDGNTDFQVDNFSSVYWQQESDAIVQELRLISNGDGPLQWSTGIFGFKEDQKVGFYSVSDRGFCCFSGFESTQPDIEGDAFAIYGDITFQFSDRARLVAGLRYTDESKSRVGGLLGGTALVNGGSGFSCCIGTRLGTEGFRPALLDRPGFNAPDPNSPNFRAEQAQLILDGISSAGARDDIQAQLIDVINGTSPNGNGACATRPDNDNGFATCPENGFFSFQGIGAPVASNGESEDSFTDFRLGIEYDVSDRQMVYAKISTAHKSGGFNDNISPNIAPEFDPEDVVVYEVGSRLSFEAFGAPAIFNATAFYYEYNDQVFQSLEAIGAPAMGGESALSLVNANVAESEITGLELEGRFNLPSNLSLDLFLSLLDSEIKSGEVTDARLANFGRGAVAPGFLTSQVSPQIDLSGNRLPLQSDLELTVRLAQSIDLGAGEFDWQILAKYRSDYFLSQYNEDDLIDIDPARTVTTAAQLGQLSLQESFATVNFGMGYTINDGRLRFEMFGQNIFDEQASQKALVGNNFDLRFLNDARTWGVRAIARF